MTDRPRGIQGPALPSSDMHVAMVMRRAEEVFDEHAQQYDAWYDSPRGRALLATEVSCLRPLLERLSRPYLEIGVGTGRFAQALGIEYGVDPSPEALEKARSRGIKAVLGVGEDIPFEDARFGGVLMAFTLCFVRGPDKVLGEVGRVLAPGGGLVLGLLLKGTPWADHYARLAVQGHPLYSLARFYAREEVETILEASGFSITAYRSTLFQEPGLEDYREERSVDGYVPGAGFVGVAAARFPRPQPG